jgi:trehalose 6-phosphate synthase/phosphatase
METGVPAETRPGAPSGGATPSHGGGAEGVGGRDGRGREPLTDQDGVLIVQYCLPVKLTKAGGGLPRAHSSTTSLPASGSSTNTLSAVAVDAYNGWSAQWDDEALLAPKGGMVRALRSVRVKWIGVCPVPVPHEDEEAVTRLLESMNCIPVFLPAATQSEFYEGYCRDTLWPVFHNVIDVYGEFPTRWWVKGRQSDRWKAYMDANGKFAVTVVENYHEGDLVWVQDIHLLLVPALLARRHIANTAIFLHTPFASSEIFRSLSVHDELLRGMLAADHIGFHLFEYARHFLTSCRRILGLTHTVRAGGCLAIEYQGREVIITVSHVGVEPSHMLSAFKSSPIIVVDAAGWRNRFPGAKIVAGIDSIERLKGLPLKLRAWEAFLERHPESVGRVVLVQLCIKDPSSGRPADLEHVGGDRPGEVERGFEAAAAEIYALVARTNARFGRPGLPAVHLELRDAHVPMLQRLALWSAADVMINASIRDGLSLYPCEYVYARAASECLSTARDAAAGLGETTAVAAVDAELSRLDPGILILSEFTSASRVLFGSIKINPWKIEDVIAALAHALTASTEEATARAEANLQYVRGNTTAAWAQRVLMDIKAAGKRGSGAGRMFQGYGLGLGYRLMGFGATFRPLNVENVLTAYRRATHRLFVFDYGGTLNVRDSGKLRQRAFELGLLHGKDAAPPLTAETKRALKLLSEDPRNTVFVVSGKEKDTLAAAFATLPHVGLSAEHGFYFRWGATPPSRLAAGSTPSSPGLGSKPGSPFSRGAKGGSTGSLSLAGLALPGPQLGPAAPSVDNGQPWETVVPYTPMGEWKSLAGTVMDSYAGACARVSFPSSCGLTPAPLLPAARTNGAFTLRKGSAVSWHYTDADPEFGSMQAKELTDHLAGVLGGYPVQVLSGHGYVEVRPQGVNKGAIVDVIMRRLEGRPAVGAPPPAISSSSPIQGPAIAGALSAESGVPRLTIAAPSDGPAVVGPRVPHVGGGFSLGTSPAPRALRARPLEFILCVGDDLADEEMFAVVQRGRAGRLGSAPAGQAGAAAGTAPTASVAPLTYYEYTVTVGRKPSNAQYYLDDTQGCEDALRSIARVAAKSSRPPPASTGGTFGSSVPVLASKGEEAAPSPTVAGLLAAGGRGLGGLFPAPLRGASRLGAGSLPANLHSVGEGEEATVSAGAAGGLLGVGAHPRVLPHSISSSPYSFAMPGGAGTLSDLNAYMSLMGSTTNIAGLNTNIVLDGSAVGVREMRRAASAGVSAGPLGRPMGQLPGLPGGALSMLNLPSANSAPGSPSGSSSGMAGGVARTAAVRPGVSNALAGLAAAFSASSARLASMLPAQPALGRVQEQGGEEEEEGEDDRSGDGGSFAGDEKEDEEEEGAAPSPRPLERAPSTKAFAFLPGGHEEEVEEHPEF